MIAYLDLRFARRGDHLIAELEYNFYVVGLVVDHPNGLGKPCHMVRVGWEEKIRHAALGCTGQIIIFLFLTGGIFKP